MLYEIYIKHCIKFISNNIINIVNIVCTGLGYCEYCVALAGLGYIKFILNIILNFSANPPWLVTCYGKYGLIISKCRFERHIFHNTSPDRGDL